MASVISATPRELTREQADRLKKLIEGAQTRDVEAMTNLAIAYQEGAFVGKKNPQQAQKWFELAAAAGGLLSKIILNYTYYEPEFGISYCRNYKPQFGLS
jgi:TPR repeat protein